MSLRSPSILIRRPTSSLTSLKLPRGLSHLRLETQLPILRQVPGSMPPKRPLTPSFTTHTSLQAPKRAKMPIIRGNIELSSQEERFCNLLDECAKKLRASEPGQEELELRIAGGWVRDKVRWRICLSVRSLNHYGCSFWVSRPTTSTSLYRP